MLAAVRRAIPALARTASGSTLARRRLSSPAPGPQPLRGTLVVALEQAIAAPYCTSRLADAGARVIKVERKDGRGDFARGYDAFAKGQSAYFVWVNRGKESLPLDLKDDGDQALLHRILARADVWVQNLAPGAAERAGFGAAELRERYPRLVTCDISGYGGRDAAGAYWDMKAYDMLVQAESGLSALSGRLGSPTRVGVSVADISCGMHAHAAVLEALMEARLTGRGTAIDASLFGCLADWMTVPLFHYEADGEGPAIGQGLRHPSVQPYAAYETSGDPVLISVQNEREFRDLCGGVLGRPELASDDRFSSNLARCRNSAALDEVIREAFLAMDRVALLERLREHRIAFGEVKGLPAFARHPALGRVLVQVPGGGAVEAVAPPARFDGAPRELRPVPAYGEHEESIRREFAAPA